jgi:galactokinase
LTLQDVASMPRHFRAPGRVNLIGDHTDYNDGYVMPMAIQLETIVTISERAGHALVLRSDAADAAAVIDLREPLRPRRDWTDYVAGVAHVLRQEGFRIEGAELAISSTVPQGAGLSSSAALEVASAFALLTGEVPDRVALARWCQRAENEFVGARCGIMDQYVACLAEQGHALLIDCRSLASRAVPIPANAAVIVSNSMVKHSIAGGEYNRRREQCESAVRRLAAVMPEVHALRDVSRQDLDRHADLLPALERKRARHVVSENERVTRAADALARSDLLTTGALMRESHLSLRDDFEVSAPELNLLADFANGLPGVFGSRMTGGGFGGSTVTLADARAASAIVSALRESYRKQTGTLPDVIVCVPSAGASEKAA